MKNDIQESYVNFENAVLLKEKGFDCFCYRTISEYDKTPSPFPIIQDMVGDIVTDTLDYKWCNSKIHKTTFALPTTALAISWIRENFGIHVSIHCHVLTQWCYQITRLIPFQAGSVITKSLGFDVNDYNSSEEAEQAAITYTLKHLI